MRLDLTAHLPGNIYVICNKMRSASWNCHLATAKPKHISHAGQVLPSSPLKRVGGRWLLGTLLEGDVVPACPLCNCRQKADNIPWPEVSARWCDCSVQGCSLALFWFLLPAKAGWFVPGSVGLRQDCTN